VTQVKSGVVGVFPLSVSLAPVASTSIAIPAWPAPWASVAEHVTVCAERAGFVSLSGEQSRRDAIHVFSTTSVLSGSDGSVPSARPSFRSTSTVLSSAEPGASKSIHAV
jgi:hypothetical protein